MLLKMDRFTWIVIAAVLLLLAGAVVTIAVGGENRLGAEETYLEEDSPAAAVHNAYVAFLNGDLSRAEESYSEDALAEMGDRGALTGRFNYSPGNSSQRLRILDVEVGEEGQTATVTIAVDHYNTGGLFNSGSTYTNRQILPLVREEDAWKIDTPYFFY